MSTPTSGTKYTYVPDIITTGGGAWIITGGGAWTTTCGAGTPIPMLTFTSAELTGA